MSKLPKNVGLLGGIVVFCAALLAALLCGCAPLAAAKKAALCGAASAMVAWLCVHIAVSVLRDGVRSYGQEDGL